jgi:6-phosphogluconate dehydrogenase (decarboxylating)
MLPGPDRGAKRVFVQICDGGGGGRGEAYYRDDIDRASALAAKGIHFLDVGTSGGSSVSSAASA